MNRPRSIHFLECAFRYIVSLFIVLGLFPPQFNYTFAQSGRTLRGIVVDSLDEGISDASVSLHSGTTVLKTTSESDGRFEFANLPAGEYDLTVARRGFNQQTIKGVLVDDKDPERVKIVLQPGPLSSGCYDPVVPYFDKNHGSISGLVLSDVDVRGLQSSLVRIKPQSQPISRQFGLPGEFTFAYLEPSSYMLRVSYQNGKEICSKRVKIPRNKIKKMDIRLHTQDGRTVCQLLEFVLSQSRCALHEFSPSAPWSFPILGVQPCR